MRRMIQMIATDLDGTLLAPGGMEMPERNKTALERATAMGVQTVICTGRIFSGGQKFALSIPGDQPVVCVNGAIVRMSRSLEYLRRVPVKPELAQEVLAFLKDHDARRWYYCGDVCMAEEESEALESLRRRTNAHVEIVPDLSKVIGNGPEKILTYLPPEEAAAIQKELEIAFAGRLYITRSSASQVEILDPASTKGQALEMLAKRFSIPRENIVAFGDNLNDLELFKAAGIKVAMGNAEDRLKEQADIIAPPNDEGGVGKVVEDLLGLK